MPEPPDHCPSIFDEGLDRRHANHVPLTPIDFLERAARVYPDKVAIIHGERRVTYAEFHARCRRLAAALSGRGIGRGDTVAVMCPNIPQMLECHFAVPMAGAVLNAINTRLDAGTVSFILEHGEAKAVLADRGLGETMGTALARASRKIPLIVTIDDPLEPEGDGIEGATDYETLVAEGDPAFAPRFPADEWDALALNYTSGTTGNPKGVVYHHRGAYLNALSNALTFALNPRSVYLWTLPMFHCNGWTYPWAVTAVAGTHVCLRKMDTAAVFRLIRDHGVTHMCGAPVILTMLIHAPAEHKLAFPQTVEIATGGAAPPSTVVASMESLGFKVTHLYGMTECYGPSTTCAPQPAWERLPLEERAARMARQGVAMVGVSAYAVKDIDTMADVPADGSTIGMLMLRSSTVMKGYLKNPEATEAALGKGWLDTGDLAVMHEDGYVEIKDRAKDIIISGGENISSLEIEEVLFRHPDVMEAAVVAAPHETWGETPWAFVTPKPGREHAVDEQGLVEWCRDHMARFKVPSHIIFRELPKTATGKLQKFVLRSEAKELAARRSD